MAYFQPPAGGPSSLSENGSRFFFYDSTPDDFLLKIKNFNHLKQEVCGVYFLPVCKQLDVFPCPPEWVQ